MVKGGVRGIRQDTINERAVRILLECILVDYVEDQLWSLASYEQLRCGAYIHLLILFMWKIQI